MYHESFKKAVVTLYEYFGSMRRTAAVLKISIASVSRWSKAKGNVMPRKRPTMITDAIKESVRVFLQRETRLSSIDVVNHIHATFGFTVSRQLAHIVIRRLGFTFKRTRKRGLSKRKSEATPPFLSSFMETVNRGNNIVTKVDLTSDHPQRTVMLLQAFRLLLCGNPRPTGVASTY